MIIDQSTDSHNHTQVGNEFSSVEALWSHFENVMAKDAGGNGGADGGAAASANAVAGEQDEVVRNARSSE